MARAATRTTKSVAAKPTPARTGSRRMKAKYGEIDLKATGPMPEWDDIDSLSPEQLSKRLAEGRFFYYYHHSIKEMRPFITEYYAKSWTKAQAKAFNKVKDWQIPVQFAAMCKMAIDGAKWDDEGTAWCAKKLDELLKAGGLVKDVVEVAAKPKINIHDRVKDIRDDIIGEIEGFEDQLIREKKYPTINILTWLRQKTVPQQIIGDIEKVYVTRLDFMKSARDSKDKCIQEGFKDFKKKDWDNWIKWYTTLVADLADYKRVKAATRKPRASKPVSPEKVVRSLKYMKTFSDVGITLTSIKPTEILHAEQLWVFNTKTRKLIRYIASDMDKELTVKGSTILGWDTKKSVGKTLRKPKEQLEQFMKSGKVQLRTFLDGIKATEIKANGRINDQTILLRVVK